MSNIRQFRDDGGFDQSQSTPDDGNFSHEAAPFDALAIHQLLSNEDYRRGSDASYGMLDIALSAKGMLATTLGSTLQQELVNNPAERQILKGSHDIFALMAEAPFEWKGVTLALGAFALTNAASRVRSYHRLDRDSAKALDQIYSSEQYIPATRSQTMLRRTRQRLGRGAVTAAACYGAYKIGEQHSAIEDLYGGMGLVATSIVTIQAAKYRARQFSNRIRFPSSHFEHHLDNEIEYQ